MRSGHNAGSFDSTVVNGGGASMAVSVDGLLLWTRSWKTHIVVAQGEGLQLG